MPLDSEFQKKVDDVLDNDEAAVQAAMLYILIKGHLDHCQHKRCCPERMLWDEAEGRRKGVLRADK